MATSITPPPPPASRCSLATYFFSDDPGTRVHCWGFGTPLERWAVGDGPIKNITAEQGFALLGCAREQMARCKVRAFGGAC